MQEIEILKRTLADHEGWVYFEFSIPRMGKRIDVVLIVKSVIFVLEFKVGEDHFPLHAIDQVTDYALDLKNFHEGSHKPPVAPILIATHASPNRKIRLASPHADNLFSAICCSPDQLPEVITTVLHSGSGPILSRDEWERSRYLPTPTIIEAATALYSSHTVEDIVRKDASSKNLTHTSSAVSTIIAATRRKSCKAICFVTGVPGSGKTLVGLDIATIHLDPRESLYSVYLSGNAPLVAVLREALARDKIGHDREKGHKTSKKEAMSEVSAFIQNVHHFRDECLIDKSKPPVEHVALFDEAQRAWTAEKTSSFMRRRKKIPDFQVSEPEYLVSCLDRHADWAVIVCLVGGGQEIHDGEAGISEWIAALQRRFPHWNVYISSRLKDSEYGAANLLKYLQSRRDVEYVEDLHLGVSLRSFRAEKVSLLVKQLLDLETNEARNTFSEIQRNYPIMITRNLSRARQWLKGQARGTQRYGIIASSDAYRLKPHAIDVRWPADPVHWFLDSKQDVRSSFYLEDVATEFQIQGLELDWACVTWDADLRYTPRGWAHHSFRGTRWNQMRKLERQKYHKNAYRVLLTRARQGMVIVVPEGDPEDHTRKPAFYNPTFDYLRSIGFPII